MNLKRKLHRWIPPITWFLLGAIVGIGAIIIWYCSSSTIIKEKSEYDSWEIAYYIFSVIGAIGTLLAVIVALTKEAIMKWIYSPDLKVYLIDEGITEVIANESQRVPEANSYDCYVKIENNGSLAALGCRAFISEIKYGRSKPNLKTIKNLKNKQMRWVSAEVDMPVGIPNRIRLFEIVNPNNIGTPQAGADNQKSKIIFNGCELRDSQSEKGFWEIDYFISCKNGDVSKFVATVEWSGDFKSRAADMVGLLKVQIEEK